MAQCDTNQIFNTALTSSVIQQCQNENVSRRKPKHENWKLYSKSWQRRPRKCRNYNKPQLNDKRQDTLASKCKRTFTNEEDARLKLIRRCWANTRLTAAPPASDGRLLLIEIAVASATVQEWGLLWGWSLRRLHLVENHLVWHRWHDSRSRWTMLMLLAVITWSKAAVEPASRSNALNRHYSYKFWALNKCYRLSTI